MSALTLHFFCALGLRARLPYALLRRQFTWSSETPFKDAEQQRMLESRSVTKHMERDRPQDYSETNAEALDLENEVTMPNMSSSLSTHGFPAVDYQIKFLKNIQRGHKRSLFGRPSLGRCTPSSTGYQLIGTGSSTPNFGLEELSSSGYAVAYSFSGLSEENDEVEKRNCKIKETAKLSSVNWSNLTTSEPEKRMNEIRLDNISVNHSGFDELHHMSSASDRGSDAIQMEEDEDEEQPDGEQEDNGDEATFLDFQVHNVQNDKPTRSLIQGAADNLQRFMALVKLIKPRQHRTMPTQSQHRLLNMALKSDGVEQSMEASQELHEIDLLN
ncbi:unnamed protein product [Protopolystoma xenopodis]|uniref:Uncharacterized protein n=1 Tax=Protopolystoma xenopodis TaxID=117903 RepID=A0A448WXJ4_9PLAT|nr:unnamed protein product [Protopolystoma xenopodis]